MAQKKGNIVIATGSISKKFRMPKIGRAGWLSALVLLATTAAVMADDFTWTTNSDNTITITGYTGSGGDVTISNSLNGLLVTSIGESAFKDCTNLTSVMISRSVTNIGNEAFGDCRGLTSVTIPDSITSIGDAVFSNCWSLTSVAIPDGVTSIGNAVFYQCTNLTDVTILNSVTSIGNSAFYYCSSLTHVTIPYNVTNLGTLAFSDCMGLNSIYFEGNVPAIESPVFAGNTNATIYYLPGTIGWGPAFDGLPTASWNVFNYTTNSYDTNTITITITDYSGPGVALNIPNTINGRSVTSIGSGAFAFTSLIGVTIPNGVTSIGDGAFLDCTSLSNVMISASVTNIGGWVFDYCANLTAITVDGTNPVYSSVNGVLFDKSQTTLIQYPTGKAGSYTIPNSVTNIADHAFYECQHLTSVTIPGNVVSIGDGAFLDCTSLTNATIGNGVASIGYDAFSATSLTSVTIPASVTSIGDDAFYYCAGLINVYFRGSAPSIGSSVFDSDNIVTVYRLPDATGWDSVGLQTALWRPRVAADSSFGLQSNQFGFNINWDSGMVIVVEARTSLVNGAWTPLQTNTLTADSLYFSDSNWTNYHSRFYRIISQ